MQPRSNFPGSADQRVTRHMPSSATQQPHRTPCTRKPACYTLRTAFSVWLTISFSLSSILVLCSSWVAKEVFLPRKQTPLLAFPWRKDFCDQENVSVPLEQLCGDPACPHSVLSICHKNIQALCEMMNCHNKCVFTVLICVCSVASV